VRVSMRRVLGPIAVLGLGGCKLIIGWDDPLHYNPDGAACTTASDCESLVCHGGVCAAPSCHDGVKNGTETDVDCGGQCSGCGPGETCEKSGDCKGGLCVGMICQPTCTDGVKDGKETGVDCGGPMCKPCADGQGCGVDADCASDICKGGACVTSYVWSAGFGDATPLDAFGNGIAADGSNNILVTGTFSAGINFGGGPLMAEGVIDGFITKFDPNGKFVWYKQLGYSGAVDVALAVTADAAGNVYATGGFMNHLAFGPGVFVDAPTGVEAIYVVKLNSFGNGVWCKEFGSAGSQSGYAIAVDGDGEVLVTGALTGTADFGMGPLTSKGARDVFVLKLDANGSPLWGNQYGDASDQAAGSIAVDAQKNIILAGTFAGSISFGGPTYTAVGTADIYVAKLDPTGAYLWSKQFGDTTGNTSALAVVDPSGDVALAGAYFGSVDFGGDNLISAGDSDLYLAKLAGNDGSHMWSKRFGDANRQESAAIALDAAGNPLLTSSCDGTVDFGGGPLVSAGGPANGGEDIFIAKFDTQGNYVWAGRFGDAQQQDNGAVAVDSTGAALMTGNFLGSIDFGGGPLMNAGGGGHDIFVAKILTP
jgi:hypothetical protein